MEIGICGCGPAGLSAALLLHRAGHRVRIFERFESPAPVGSGLILQPTGLGVLAELGLAKEINSLGARIDRLFGRVVPSQRVVLDVRYEAMGAGLHAVAVHRAALFNLLFDATRAAGIEVIPGTQVARLERTPSGSTLYAANATRLGSFDLVVNALGVNSPLTTGIGRRTTLPYAALWVNVPWDAHAPFALNALEQRYQRASRTAGVLPIGKRTPDGPLEAAFFWSLRRADVDIWRNRGVAAWKADVAELWPEALPLLRSVVDLKELTFAQYDDFMAAKPYADGLVHIGDAAHSSSPQLGQGANMALLDALALARALQANPDMTEALPAYARMRYWHVRLFQWASAAFTPFYQSDSRLLPFVRDWITAPLSRLPVADALLARLVSGMTTAPLARHSVSPRAVPPLQQEPGDP